MPYEPMITEQATTEQVSTEQVKLAEAVRQACIAAALDAYEDARMDGLCHEGAWECAVDAMRALDVAAVVGHQAALSSDESGSAALS